ncbi:MAG: hypothetical protein V4487_04270, partial [Chlamydiota bacterium]
LQALKTLKTAQLLNLQTEIPQYEFFATDDPEKFRVLGKIFFESEIQTVKSFQEINTMYSIS